MYARISCGARKKYAARKPFTATSSPKGWVNAVTWDEDFTFHVPQAAPNLKISFFDDKDTEVKCHIIFSDESVCCRNIYLFDCSLSGEWVFRKSCD